MRVVLVTPSTTWLAIFATAILHASPATAASISLGALTTLGICQPERAPLGRGHPAPALADARWVPEGSEVRFGNGRVTVLAFFSTASDGSMDALGEHHALREWLRRTGVDAVDMIGVAVRPARDAISVDDLVKGVDELDYPVCVDGTSGAIAAAYLGSQATAELPISFIVGKSGTIEWYGDPWRGMFDVVQAVAADRFDPIAFEARQRQIDRDAEALSERLERALFAQDWPRVATSAGELAELGRRFQSMTLLRYEAYLHGGKTARAARYGEELLTRFADDPTWLNELAWNIVSPTTSIDADRLDLPLARRAAERAVEVTRRKRDYVLDTLARCCFREGDIERAIAVQREAITVSTLRQVELRAVLEEYLRDPHARDADG